MKFNNLSTSYTWSLLPFIIVDLVDEELAFGFLCFAFSIEF